MSNLWLNIRFGLWHLQGEGFKLKLSKNMYHIDNTVWFEVYRFFNLIK